MSAPFELYDLIRAHDFSSDPRANPPCYLEGAVLEESNGWLYFAVTKRVFNGEKEPVRSVEIQRTPVMGKRTLDSVDPHRIEFIRKAPRCFSAPTEECLLALTAFKDLLHKQGRL